MKKRLLSIIMVLALCLGLMPTVALAASGSVKYLNDQGIETTYTGEYTELTNGNPGGTSWSSGWYVVTGNNVIIGNRVTVSGDVHLILADNCTLTVNGGIQVQDDDNTPSNGSSNALTIYAQSVPVLNEDGTVDEANNTAGKLIAQKVGDDDLNAAIGGNGSDTDTGSGGDGGTITINGGIVEAEGDYGAGIGGGSSGTGGGTGHISDIIGGSSGTITINGGAITASSISGAGIGGGGSLGFYKDKDNGNITINGGTITASSDIGAGIGSGNHGSGGKITITGGIVTATSEAGAGIGSGSGNNSIGGGEITITGGNVTAESTVGVGIGASRIFPDNSVDGTITINDGTVTAIGGNAQEKCYGILANNMTVKGGSVKVESGSPTKTYGQTQSYGIYAATELTISGNANVTATGGKAEDSYGIYAATKLTINGGHVTAQTLAGTGTNKAALSTSPNLDGYSNYFWRTSPEDSFTPSSDTNKYTHTSETYVEFSNGYTYTITLNSNFVGGESSTVITGTDGKLTEALPTLNRDGYNFVGWFTTDGTKVTNDTKFDKNTTIYAHWTAETTTETYTVTLYTNGGTINSGNITAYTCGQVTALPTDVTRAGYTFAGWYDNAAFTGNPVTAIGADATGEKAYWAKWVYTAVPDEIPYVPQAPQNGWKSLTAGSVYYKNGVKVKGLQQIDGETYYFDEKGYLQTGWVELDGNWYYFDAAMQTGWLKLGNTWYYLDPRNGAMAEDGMQEIDGATYYFYDWGGMASNFWYLDEKGGWYYFGGNGAMVENKWVLWKGAWYYLGSDGAMLAEKWLYWNGEWYYLGSDGAMLTNTTTPDGYYVNNEGVWVK